MIAIKTSLKEMPKYCEDCVWYENRPHPHKVWTEICELMAHCMDDDQEDEWIYDGGSRPVKCPLVDIKDREGD